MAIESGVDASSFATKDQLESVDEALEQLDKNVSDFVDYALEKMATKEYVDGAIGTPESGKSYRLIETRTIEEDLSVVEFTNLNLSAFYIEVEGGFVDGTQSTLYLDVNGYPLSMNTTVNLNADTSKGFYIRSMVDDDGFIVCQVTQGASGNYKPFNAQMGASKITILPPSANIYSKVLPFKKISMYTGVPAGGTKKWLSGSKFTLWGIENDEN